MSKGSYIYSDELMGYDMGPSHPMQPIRLKRTTELLKLYGAFDDVEVVAPTVVSFAELTETHSIEFIRAVDYLSTGRQVPASYHRYGFGSGDNPVFPGIYEASCLYTGASVQAAQAVIEGDPVAMSISGGLHHAHYSAAAGFCVFNDCAAAAHRLRRKFDRVAYIDIDVHHGDGVQELFYSDPSVLTISIHQSGKTLFPGTGSVSEIGHGDGEGYSVNLPVFPFTTDEIWLNLWRKVGLSILKAFNPQAIVLQCGTDAHYLDPLANVALTAQGWLEAIKDVHSLGVPIVALGGGGYNQTTVPRMWALAFGELFGIVLPESTPDEFSFHDKIPRLRDNLSPETTSYEMNVAAGFAEETIREVETRIFPYHGL